MTLRQFLALRRTRRLARKADKAMFKAYGGAWVLNAQSVVQLLTAPSNLVAVDVRALEGAIQEAVQVALDEKTGAAREHQTFVPAPAVPVAEEEPLPSVEASEMWPVESELEPEAEQETPRFSEAYDPKVQADLKRHEFVRNFLESERVARGLTPTN